MVVFIFIDESGTTDAKSNQKFLVVAFVPLKNRDFADQLIFEIRDICKKRGRPITKKELKYHSLEPFQREIAVQTINSKYRNFHVCFFDVDNADRDMVSGEYEQLIQMKSIHHVLSTLDKGEMRKHGHIKVLMDKKLSDDFKLAIEDEFQKHMGTKKGISVETVVSSKERGIQLADLIAGAFRAKLMKKSGLFEVDHTRVFQISASDAEHFKTEKT
jgi:hypothetical protein